jgi:hypothetical protein
VALPLDPANPGAMPGRCCCLVPFNHASPSLVVLLGPPYTCSAMSARCTRLEAGGAGDARSVLDTVSPAQSYDIQLMLFALPHVLLGAVTALTENRSRRSMPAPTVSGITPNSKEACHAIIAEIAAVAVRCCAGSNVEEVTQLAGQPKEALHLQAIVGALDALTRCVPASSLIRRCCWFNQHTCCLTPCLSAE